MKYYVEIACIKKFLIFKLKKKAKTNVCVTHAQMQH